VKWTIAALRTRGWITLHTQRIFHQFGMIGNIHSQIYQDSMLQQTNINDAAKSQQDE